MQDSYQTVCGNELFGINRYITRIGFLLILNIWDLLSLMLPIKSYEIERNCPILEKGEKSIKKSKNLHENCTIKFSVSENHTVEVSSFHKKKCGTLHSFSRRKMTDMFLFIFFQGCLYQIKGSKRLEVGAIKRTWRFVYPFYSNAPFPLKSSD